MIFEASKPKERSMEVVQLPKSGRRAFCLSFAGLLALASGCGDATNTPATPEDTKSKNEAEAAARQKAMEAGEGPGKTGKGKPKPRG